MDKNYVEAERGRYGLNGEITVFLSLILTCICALMCGLLESARVAGSGWYLQMAVNSSLDSLMSQYHRDIWEEYHLLLLEFEDGEGLAAEMEPYFKAYLENQASVRLKPERLEVSQPIKITEKEGKWLEQEILDYMKLGVWNMEVNQQVLEELRDNMKEAGSLKTIISHYQVNTGKVLGVERALEAIGSSLKKQEQYWRTGKNKLKHCDGRGFIKTAKQLQKEINQIPRLITRYEAAAANLAMELDRSEAEAEKCKADVKADTWLAIQAELKRYRMYTDEEGERRKAVGKVGIQAERNGKIVEAAIEEAEETLEYIREWEGGDDEDELDEAPLWNAVLMRFNHFKPDLSFKEPQIKDKKKMNLLEGISRLSGGSLLYLVVPDEKEVSSSIIESSEFPSKLHFGKNNVRSEEAVGGIIKSIVDTALINEYTASHFTHFLSEGEREFKYEQEYILNGADSDRENLNGVVNRIVAVREGMNLIYLLKDQEKRQEAEALAAVITGAASVTPLLQITAFFILTVWAFAEALEDIRILLADGKTPFFKGKTDWKLSIENILRFDGKKLPKLDNDEKLDKREGGLDYQDYLKLFLLIQDRSERNYRMMDMIQKNIRKTHKKFLMEQCACQVQVKGAAMGRFLFIRQAIKAY